MTLGSLFSLIVAHLAVAQAPTGALVILTTPPGAELRVDGKSVGRAPASVTLLGGDHLVEATWPDGKSVSFVGHATPGQSTLLTLTPSGAPPQPAQALPPNAPPPMGAPPPNAPPPNAPPPMGNGMEGAPPAEGMPPPGAPLPTAMLAPREIEIRNPLHPQRRHQAGLSFAPGLLCGTASCTFRGRIALDFAFGDIHLTTLGGGFIVGGIGFGVELGTPYFQLGSLASPVALAVRADLDALAVFYDNAIVDPFGNVSTKAAVGGMMTNTFGPNVSFALAHRIALEARLGFGYGVTFPTVTTPFLLDSWIGVRVQP